MLDFEELDRKFIVQYNETKKCKFANIWTKDECPNHRNGSKGKKDGDFGWISVSDAYKHLLQKNYHFYPAGNHKETYLIAYELNSQFGDCTDDRISLYLIAKKNNRPLDFINSVGNVIDTKIEWVNRERKLANYLAGFLDESEILDTDSTTHSKDDLLRALNTTKDEISQLV